MFIIEDTCPLQVNLKIHINRMSSFEYNQLINYTKYNSVQHLSKNS